MHFLFFLNEAVVLRYASQRKLVHQVDFIRILHVFILNLSAVPSLHQSIHELP